MSILKTGSEGVEVANWQRFLLGQGFSGIEADGDFGPKTKVATIDFQRANGLRIDGEVGPATLAKAKGIPQKPIHASMLLAVTMAPAMEKLLFKVHPILADKVRKVVASALVEGHVIKVSQGLRTFKEQDELFRQRPRVTQARGGQSMHNYGLACDLVFLVNGKISWEDKLYQNIGRWAAAAGLEWGGNWRSFKDMPHVQLNGLPSYKVLLPIYNKGGLEAVWAKYKG